MTLIPNLYTVQKILQDNYTKYGPLIYIDPNSYGESRLGEENITMKVRIGGISYGVKEAPIQVKPSKEKNIETMTRIGDALYNFSVKAKNIDSYKDNAKDSIAWFIWPVTVVLVILIVVALVIFVFLGFACQDKFFIGWRLGLDGLGNTFFGLSTISKIIIFLAILLVLVIFCLALHVNLVYGLNKMEIIDKVLNWRPINSQQISEVISMFDVTKIENNDVTVSSKNPGLMWYWSKHHPNINLTWSQDGQYCSNMSRVTSSNRQHHQADDVFLSSCKSRVFDYVSGSNNSTGFNIANVDDNYYEMMYPFIGSNAAYKMPIEPSVLLTQIKQWDLYGQLNRMKSSVEYFNGLLLRQNDDMYGSNAAPSSLNESQVTSLRYQIATVLLSGGGGGGSNARNANTSGNATSTTKPFSSSNLSFSDSLVFNQNKMVGSITDIIVGSDPSQTFNLSQQDVLAINDIVLQSISDSNQYKIASGPLTTILTDVQGILPQAYLNASANASPINPIYVPMERFVQKIGTMSTDIFINSFVFNIEEVRTTSYGIQKLNDLYDVTTISMNMNKNLNVALTSWSTMGFILIFLIIGVLVFGSTNPKVDYYVDGGINWDYSKIINKCLIVLVTATVLILIYMMAWSYTEKVKTLAEFNQNMMITNGQSMVNNSQDALSIIFDDMIDNRYGVSGSNLTDIKIESKNLAYPSIDQQYDTILKNVNTSPNVQLSIHIANNLSDVYDKLIIILEAYKECNSLFSLNTSKVSFPIVETVSYGFLIVLLCIVLVIILGITELNPFIIWKQFTDSNPGGSTGTNVPFANGVSSPGVISGLMQTPQDDPFKDLPYLKNPQFYLKICGFVFIVIVLSLFASGIKSNADGFTSGLYSNMMASTACI